MHFLEQVITYPAASIFILALICLFGFGYPGYRDRATGGFWWILWLIGGIVAVIVWFRIVLT